MAKLEAMYCPNSDILAVSNLLLAVSVPRLRRALGTASMTLCHLAFLLARQQRFADAARLLGAVLAPPNRASYDDAAAIVSDALGHHDLDRLKAEGRTLNEEKAVALALPESNAARVQTA